MSDDDDDDLDERVRQALMIEAEEAREAGAVGFIARVLTQATMPHKATSDNPFYRNQKSQYFPNNYMLRVMSFCRIGASNRPDPSRRSGFPSVSSRAIEHPATARCRLPARSNSSRHLSPSGSNRLCGPSRVGEFVADAALRRITAARWRGGEFQTIFDRN